MASTVIPDRLFYYVGEKPPQLPCGYYDDDNVLVNTIAGATLTAKCRLDDGTEFDITIDNSAGDGTFLINWATGTSSFTAAGMLRIDIEVDDGTRVWYMPRFSVTVKDRYTAPSP